MNTDPAWVEGLVTTHVMDEGGVDGGTRCKPLAGRERRAAIDEVGRRASRPVPAAGGTAEDRGHAPAGMRSPAIAVCARR